MQTSVCAAGACQCWCSAQNARGYPTRLWFSRALATAHSATNTAAATASVATAAACCGAGVGAIGAGVAAIAHAGCASLVNATLYGEVHHEGSTTCLFSVLMPPCQPSAYLTS